MDRIEVTILLTAAFTAITIPLVYGLMIIAARFIHRSVSAAIGVAFSGFIAWAVASYGLHCAEPPEIILPLPGEEGEGNTIFNCDAPWGTADRAFIYLIGPVWFLASVFATILFWRRSTRFLAI